MKDVIKVNVWENGTSKQKLATIPSKSDIEAGDDVRVIKGKVAEMLKVWKNTSNGQKLITIPKESTIVTGDEIEIRKVKLGFSYV